MELWVRSQNKKILTKVDELGLSKNVESRIGNNKSGTLGEYKTKERALEVIDEIQKKMTQTFLLKENKHIHPEEMDSLRRYYRRKEINFVEVPNSIELESINKDILVYEMPEE